MAVAARVTNVHGKANVCRKDAVKRVRVRRRSRTHIPRFARLGLCVFALASLFGYVNQYANLATTSANLNRITLEYRQEKIRNERLKLDLITSSSPRSIVAAAEKSGMEYATQYDYLHKPQTVASAGTGQ